jgi:hypothetical protein
MYQFADGFDNYNTLSQLWQFTAGSPVIGSAYKRFAPPSGLAGQGLYLPSGAYARRNMISNQSTVIGKVAYYATATPTGSGAEIMGFPDANTGGYQTALVWTPAGALELWTAWASPYLTLRASTAPGIIAPNSYNGIEMLLTISTAAAGIVQVWVNGLEVMNVTGIITAPTSSGYVNQIQISDGSIGCYYDDVRLWDSTGTTQNTPVGASLQDTRLITVLPAGPGAFTQFTPNGAAANWQCTDDNPPDGDTTYVSGSTAGLQDAYAMQNPLLTVSPLMVVGRSYARKDDSSTRSLGVGAASAGVGSLGPTTALASTYGFVDGCIPNDPSTGVPWTAAGANAAQHYKEEIV